MKETFIQNAPLFSSLSPDEQQIIGEALKPQAFAKGETLLTQGQPTASLFLIQSGWVKQATVLDSGRTILNNLGPGSLVGDMDLLLGQLASSSAQANSDVSVWSLSEEDLDKILNEHPLIGLKLSGALGSRVKQLERYLVQHRLRHMPLFADLERTELTAIAEKLEPLDIRRGGLIFRAGAPAERMFIVEQGEVMLTSTAASEPFRQLGPGDMLGEMALLTNKPYDGVARASTEVVLWALPRNDFLALTARYPNIRVAMSNRLSQPLSIDDRVLAQARLRQLALFKDLPDLTLNAIASVLVLRHYPADEQIFQAGDAGDALIIVDSGAVQLSDDQQRTSALRPGEHYGELSLLTGRSRTHSATALSDSNVWLLYKSDFEELLARYPALGDALSKAISARLASTNNLFLNQHLRRISLFAGLNDAERRDIAEVLRAAHFNRGDVIFAEGERGDAVYFIETGEVQLATRIGESYQMNFERLIAGDFFGELALLNDAPRKSTARAVVNDTQLWVLHKADFEQILTRYPQLALSLSKVLSERLARTDARANRTAGRTPIKPPTAGYLAPVTRPAAARPAPVPVAKRSPTPQTKTPARATPLKVKPPSAPAQAAAKPHTAMPQQRPVAARPQLRRAPGTPQTTAVAIRPVQRALVPVRQPVADPLTLAVVDSVKWVIERPMGTKFRMVALTILFVWLCGISAPIAIISALRAPQINEQLNALGVAVNIGDDGLPQVALGVPTFTPTPQPTNRAATGTPVPKTSPTSAPKIVASPTRAPTRVAQAQPSATPTTGPVIAPAAAQQQSSVDFKLVKVRQLTPCENNGNHNLYVVVLDKDGKGIPNIPVEFSWPDGSFRDVTGKKTENIPYLGVDAKTTAGYVDWPVFKGPVRARVVAGTSDQTEWLRFDLPDQTCEKTGNTIGNSTFHYSYLIVFQKTN